MKIVILCVLLLTPTIAAAQTCAPADLTHPLSVSMTWLDNSTDETGFILERKIGTGAFVVIAASLAANLTAYTDSTVTRGTAPITYTYRVKAYRASDNTTSVASNEACITFAANPPPPPPLAAPAGLTVSSISNSSLRVTWESVPEATTYAVEGKRANRGYYEQVAMTDQVTYDWTGLRRWSSYCVRVSAYNPLGLHSGPVCATTSR